MSRYLLWLLASFCIVLAVTDQGGGSIITLIANMSASWILADPGLSLGTSDAWLFAFMAVLLFFIAETLAEFSKRMALVRRRKGF